MSFLCWYFTLRYTRAVTFRVNENTFLTVTKIDRPPLALLSQETHTCMPQRLKQRDLGAFPPYAHSGNFAAEP